MAKRRCKILEHFKLGCENFQGSCLDNVGNVMSTHTLLLAWELPALALFYRVFGGAFKCLVQRKEMEVVFLEK